MEKSHLFSLGKSIFDDLLAQVSDFFSHKSAHFKQFISDLSRPISHHRFLGYLAPIKEAQLTLKKNRWYEIGRERSPTIYVKQE